MIFEYEEYDKYDISKFSDAYIALLVINKELKNDYPSDLDAYFMAFLRVLVKFSFEADTPPNRLKGEVISQLKRINEEDKLQYIIR